MVRLLFTCSDAITIIVTVKVNLVLTATGRMGLESVLHATLSVTIGTMLNFGGDSDRDGHGAGTCKHTLIVLEITVNAKEF